MRNAAMLLFLLPLVLLLPACRRDMFDQPGHKPLARNDFFSDGMNSRPVVAETVARGHLDEDDLFYRGMGAGTNFAAVFPFPVTRALLERGRERFEIYCSPCHGRAGDGRGMIVQRGFPPPPDFAIERLRQAPPGYFFNVITRGYGVMYPYATRVIPADRWAIAAYIRALQLSRHARVAELSATDRTRLEQP